MNQWHFITTQRKNLKPLHEEPSQTKEDSSRYLIDNIVYKSAS
jgi:hypothetical protein